MHLKHMGSDAEYIERFQPLPCRVDPLSMPKQVQISTSGLTDLRRVDVEPQNPSDLQVAMSLTHAYE